MKLYTILRNLIQGIKNALKESKNYTDSICDTKLTISDLQLGAITTNVTVNGGGTSGTAWATVTVPSDRKLIAPAGFYWSGANNSNVTCYAYLQDNATQLRIALRNWGNSAVTLSVALYYLYIQVGG